MSVNSTKLFSNVGQNPTRRIVISADYDSCFAAYEKPYKTKPIYVQFRNKIEKYINKLKNGIDVPIELYVGSNRQNKGLDKHNINKKKKRSVSALGTQSAFTTLRTLCKDKDWTFNPLLLVDTLHNVSAGTAMHDDKNDYLLDVPWGEHGEKLKRRLIQNQLDDVVKNHPDEKIDFVFFDDDKYDTIHPYLFKNIVVPQNITLHLVKADCTSDKFRKYPIKKYSPFGITGKTSVLLSAVLIWSITDRWHSTRNLQNNQIYKVIGFLLMLFVIICCFLILLMENHRRKHDGKSGVQHMVYMLGLFVALVGCVAFSLTITNTAINGYHLSFEAPASFIVATVLLAIGHANLAKSKRPKRLGGIAFLMQAVGALTLLNINEIGTKILLGIAILGVVLMIINTLLDAKDDKVITTQKCFSCDC